MTSCKVLFSVKEDEILVEMVAKFPSLYDLACATYKDHGIKDNAWKEVAEAVSRTVEDCKKRWKNIKDTYNKRQKKGTNTGSSASSKPKKWGLADMLSFLDKTNHKRGTISNIEAADNSSQGAEGDMDSEDGEEEQEVRDMGISPNNETENCSPPNNCSSTATSAPNTRSPSPGTAPPISKRPKRGDKLMVFLEKRSHERMEMLKSLSENQDDEVDLFFKSIAKSVKKLKPEFINEAKMKSLQLVCELETRSAYEGATPIGTQVRSNNSFVPSPAGSSVDYFSDSSTYNSYGSTMNCAYGQGSNLHHM